MPDVAPREVLGLQMLQREAAVGPPPDMATVLRGAAEKSLQEGRSKKALENLKDPGKSLDTAKMVGEYQAFAKNDEINDPVAGTLKKSGEQVTRMEPGENALKNIKEFVENKRYDSITDTNVKDALKKTLTDYLINNPAFLAAKQLIDPTFDVTSATARGQVETDALAILKDPLLFDGLKAVTADYLATTNIDYKELHKLLKQKMELSKEVTTLTTEVGTGGTGGSGLTKVVEDMEKDLKEYEMRTDPSNPANIIKGTYAALKEGYHNDELKNTKTQRAFQQIITDVRAISVRLDSGSIADKTVVLPDGTTKTVDKTNYSGYLLAWQTEADSLDTVIEDSKLKQQLIDQDKARKKTEFDEKKAEKKRKEDDKKLKEKTLKDLEDGSLTDEQKKVKEEEEKVSKRAQGLLAEAVTNLWQDMSTEADKARTEKLKGLEGDCQKMAIETLLKKVNPTKKAYDVKQLKKYRDELTRDGVDKFGTTRIDELIGDYSGTGATPEQQKLIPILNGIKNDPAKLKEFSTTLVKDMLGVVAYKNPKLLEKLFTEDERHMRSLLGDTLPDLILKAYEDPSARTKAEEIFGKKMTKGDIGKNLKELFKSKGFWAIFAILAALGLLGFFALKP